MDLKLSLLRGLGWALAARERKCSSRVIIGLGVIAKERAGLMSERAAAKTVEDGILMTIYVAAGQRSNLRSPGMSCWKISITIERMLAREATQ